MKKLFLFIPLCLFAVFSIAQSVSNLTISTTGASNLKITFGNKKYSLQDRSVTFQSLQPGNYVLTIFQLQKKKNNSLYNNGNNNNSGNEYVKVFDQTITLTAMRHLEICVLRFGKTTTDESNIEADEWNENSYNPRDNGYGNNNNNNGGYNNYQPVTAAQFTQIKNSLNAEYNEDNRIALAKVVLKNNWFAAAQIKELAGTFYNESKKLEFVKYAYDYCYDKGNYYTLGDIFYNQTNKRQLLDYIANK